MELTYSFPPEMQALWNHIESRYQLSNWWSIISKSLLSFFQFFIFWVQTLTRSTVFYWPWKAKKQKSFGCWPFHQNQLNSNFFFKTKKPLFLSFLSGFQYLLPYTIRAYNFGYSYVCIDTACCSSYGRWERTWVIQNTNSFIWTVLIF